MPYKKVNISTVRASPAEKLKFEKLVKKMGFSSMAHFFTRSMETLLDQVDAGQKLEWPLRFETKQEHRKPRTTDAKPSDQ